MSTRRPRAKPTPTPPADLWEQMDALRTAVKGAPEPSWFTVYDYAARYKLPKSTAGFELARLRQAGKVQMMGRYYRKTYYRLVK